MTDKEEIVQARRWIERTMSSDPDIRALFVNALTDRQYQSLTEFSRQEPDAFMVLYDAATDMVAEIPTETLESVGRGKDAR